MSTKINYDGKVVAQVGRAVATFVTNPDPDDTPEDVATAALTGLNRGSLQRVKKRLSTSYAGHAKALEDWELAAVIDAVLGRAR
jgi:hypothetical protein